MYCSDDLMLGLMVGSTEGILIMGWRFAEGSWSDAGVWLALRHGQCWEGPRVGLSSFHIIFYIHLEKNKLEAGHGLLDSISNFAGVPCPFTAGMNVANVVGDILESKGWAVVQLSDSDALCLPGTASTTTMGHGFKNMDPWDWVVSSDWISVFCVLESADP